MNSDLLKKIHSAASRNSTLYCLFIDYSKCFDTISRPFLWKNLMKMGFSTRLVKSLMSLYSKVEVRLNENVTYGEEDEQTDQEKSNDQLTTDDIESTIGLKQGCPLSPLLFSCFTNDVVAELSKNLTPSQQSRPSILLFADDMIMFSESPETLRTMIRNLEEYTRRWGLSVNLDKTQIVAFRRPRRKDPNENFYYNGQLISTVDSYQYLGVTFHYSGSWNLQLRNAKTKGTGSLFKLRDKLTKFPQMQVKDMIKLFQSCVQSGLLFGAQIWGTASLVNIETVQCNFAKYVLGVRKQTPNVGALSELGLLPHRKYVYFMIVKYWLRISES